jgi:hypothetical protein
MLKTHSQPSAFLLSPSFTFFISSSHFLFPLPPIFVPHTTPQCITSYHITPVQFLQGEKMLAYAASLACPVGAIRLKVPDPLMKKVLEIFPAEVRHLVSFFICILLFLFCSVSVIFFLSFYLSFFLPCCALFPQLLDTTAH